MCSVAAAMSCLVVSIFWTLFGSLVGMGGVATMMNTNHIQAQQSYGSGQLMTQLLQY